MTMYLDRLKDFLEEVIAIPTKKRKKPKIKKKIEDVVEDIKTMDATFLFFVNSNITTTETDTTDEVKEKAKEIYENDFLMDSEHEESIDKSHEILDADGIHVWLCDHDAVLDLVSSCFAHGLECTYVEIPKKNLTKGSGEDNLFTAVRKIKLAGLSEMSSIKLKVIEAWKPYAKLLTEQEKETDKKKSEEDEEKKKAEDEEKKKSEEDEEKKKAEDEEKKKAEDEKKKKPNFKLYSKPTWKNITSIVNPCLVFLTPKKADLIATEIPYFEAYKLANISSNDKSTIGKAIYILSAKYKPALKAFEKRYPYSVKFEELPDDFLELNNPFEDIETDNPDLLNIAAENWKKIMEDAGIEGKDKEKDTDENDDDDDDDHADVKSTTFRSIKDPWILILNPRKGKADFQNFIGPDSNEPGEPKKASKILPKASLFLISKKMKYEDEGVRVYFLNGTNASAIKNELQKINPEMGEIGPFEKDRFGKSEPFTDLKVNKGNVEPILTNEMNQLWSDINAESSGNPISAIQANTSIPLAFFRFLKKQQQPIDLYLGGHPKGAGSEGTVYVLATQQEAKSFIKIMKQFKMPSMFYDRLDDRQDIDAEFKLIDPEKYVPANVLILNSDNFDPKETIEITKENKNLAPLGSKQTQIDLLHAFAKKELGNKIQNPGTFIKGKYIIGTYVVQFNANMTVCFLWGSHTQHVKLDPKDVIKQLPFVKEVITSYL